MITGLRGLLRARLWALRQALVPLLQIAVAAGLSWWVAHDLLGHTSSYFAPVASTIVLRVVPGRRIRRAFEMVVGIAVGIAVGAAVIQEIGTGAVQIGLIVGAAVAVATLLGGGPLVASQAAGSAVLIAALPSPHA
ncbi:MAG: FUSC family protein, partial [Gaiellales bacterium]